MDTLAHGLWGGVGFYGAGPRKFASAFVLGVAPDLLSFGLFHVSYPDWIVQRLSGEASGPPPLSILPEFVFHAYNWTHSLVVWGALFALIWLVRKSPPLPLLAWGLHIVCDIPTHGLSYFPTPYLWPFSTPYVQGVAWSTPWFMLTNYTALLFAYLVAFAFARVRAAKKIAPQAAEVMLRLFAVLTLHSLFALPGWLSAAAGSDTIIFFRAIKDKEEYNRNPGKYERVIISEPTREHEYYIEREPAHVIPGAAIKSIIVRKSKIYGSSPTELQEAFKEALGTSKSERKGQGDFPRGFTYNITFYIGPPEAMRFSVFTKRNEKDLFRKRIGNRSLGLSKFDLPFEVDASGNLEMTFYLQENDTNKIKDMLSPFGGKVIWE